MSDVAGRGPRKAVAYGATRVRGGARWAMRPSGPPTRKISMRGAGDSISQWHTRAVVDLSLRLGEAMLSTGASVAETTAAVLRICRAFGMDSVHADITYTSVTISMHRGVYEDPITVMRIVTGFGMDYSRLEALNKLMQDICGTRGDPGDVSENLAELERILEMPHQYRRGIITAGWAGMGAGVAALMGGGLAMIIIAALTCSAIDRMQYRIARLGISAFFGQVLGAMLATGVTVVLLAIKPHVKDVSWLANIHPSIVVASGIVAVLAGMSVVTAAQDTLDGFYVTAAARTYEVVLLTSGVVAGVLAMLGLGKHIGVKFPIIPASLFASTLVVQVLASALLAGAFALTAYCGPISIMVATVAGGSSWALYWFATHAFGMTTALSSGAAAFVIGVCAPWLAMRLRVPAIAITASGIVPLLPGMAVYKGIMYFIQDKSGDATIPMLLGAILVALALSVGVSLGTLLGRQVLAAENSLTAKVLQRTVDQTRA